MITGYKATDQQRAQRVEALVVDRGPNVAAILDQYQIRGDYRADGSWIGFDYSRQVWVEVRADEVIS